jgi:hypothetical protein
VRTALLIAGFMAMGVGAPAQAAPPRISQLVVFKDGSSKAETVSARSAKVAVGRRRCTVGEATALAALVRSKPGPLVLRDFGSCGSRPADGAGLFVQSIAGDRNRRQDGWVYKVGRRAGSAGAADPGGPFGRGRLRSGQRVTWLYCRTREGGCQRTLEVKPKPGAEGVVATVRGYDDQGRGVAVAGATVTAGGVSAETDSRGVARLALPAGRHRVVASKPGLVRSFAERVEVP